MAVATVGSAGFASGFFRLRLGRSLGKGCRLAFGLSLTLLEVGTRLAQFVLEALVVLTELFVVLA